MNSTTAATPAQLTWRDVYPVHPCADVFPMMDTEEIDALAADIRANGLREPVVLWMNPADGRTYVLDGRNRLEALERNGTGIGTTAGLTIRIAKTRIIENPALYVISANIRRRHLTKEQQAALIVAAIEAANAATGTKESGGNASAENDRAKSARSFNPTKGQRGGSTKDPVLHAAVEAGQKHGIGKRTIQNARAKVHGVKAPKPITHKTADTAPSENRTAGRLRQRSDTRIKLVLKDVTSAIEKAVEHWPADSSLRLLIDCLRDEASRLDTGHPSVEGQRFDDDAEPPGPIPESLMPVRTKEVPRWAPPEDRAEGRTR